MLFAATWMNLEMITLTEVSQTKTNTYDITYMYIFFFLLLFFSILFILVSK